jgi:hypothetical protein
MIRQGSITVEIAQSSPGSRIDAVYTSGLNKLSVPQSLNLSEIGHQMKVIHEATHALIDFHNYRTTELIDEMAAYIADSLYGAIRHQSVRSPDSRTMSILRAALEVVSQHNMVNSRGVRLSRQDPYVAQLAQAIESHPSYDGAGGRPNYANGIPIGEHGLINPWYQPRYR